ncbi:gas vesicle protein [Rhodobacterales bacterium HKCCE3408]|nr:gas vesicle protein [Rhodobacterales bacterium HKCCE3408]
MDQPKTTEFSQAKSRGLSMAAAVKLARSEIRTVSDQPVDAVSRCDRAPDGGWIVGLDLIESPARMGENDLLAGYELRIDPDGAVLAVERTGRYRREDGRDR